MINVKLKLFPQR